MAKRNMRVMPRQPNLDLTTILSRLYSQRQQIDQKIRAFEKRAAMGPAEPALRQEVPGWDAGQSVADVAFQLWQSSAFRGGIPEEALLAAVRILKENSRARLVLVPKRKHTSTF